MSQNNQEIKKLYQTKVFWLHFLISGSLFSAIILAVIISFSFPKTTKKNVIINGSVLGVCGILNIIAIANLGNLETSSKKLKARIKLDAEILKDEWARQHLIELNQQQQQIETVLREQIREYQPQPQPIYQEIPPNHPTESPIFQEYQPNYLDIPPAEYEGFDWNKLQDTTNFPHISLEAKTGGGKSTLFQWLSSILGGYSIAVAPHYQTGDFPACDLIVGRGRHYGENLEDCNFNFIKIINGQENPSVIGFIKALHQEMQYRYERSNYAAEPPIIVGLDEYNAYAKIKGVSELIKQLVRESRKVNIRLVFLCQGLEAEAMGFKGEVNSLRACLTRIRLGNHAINYAQTKLNGCKNNSPDYKSWQAKIIQLKQLERPCLIEDTMGDEVAIIPDLSNWKVVNPNQKILPGASINLNKTIVKAPIETIEHLIDQAEIEEDNIQSCNHQNVRKNGFTSAGRQRWLCSDCGQTTSGDVPFYESN